MNDMPYRVAAERLKATFGEAPTGAVVLGSGLKDFPQAVSDIEGECLFSDVGLMDTSVSGHSGRIFVGTLGNERVVVLSGRLHFYEGHGTEPVCRPIRALACWGVQKILLTSAVGALHRDTPPGSFVQVIDHINLTGQDPLMGPNDPDLGTRFPDMSTAYDSKLGAIAQDAAQSHQIPLPTGIYIAKTGPSYETPAEVRMMQGLGADVAGMSLIHEAIAGSHAGIRVLAIAVVSNYAAGLEKKALSHDEVAQVVGAASSRMVQLAVSIVSKW